MSLRKLPRCTHASLAARRANALKSTSPRRERGNARVALNPLKHGWRAMGLRERLARAGYREDEASYRRIRSRLSSAFTRRALIRTLIWAGKPTARRAGSGSFGEGYTAHKLNEQSWNVL
jgi:hypothetical protein